MLKSIGILSLIEFPFAQPVRTWEMPAVVLSCTSTPVLIPPLRLVSIRFAFLVLYHCIICIFADWTSIFRPELIILVWLYCATMVLAVGRFAFYDCLTWSAIWVIVVNFDWIAAVISLCLYRRCSILSVFRCLTIWLHAFTHVCTKPDQPHLIHCFKKALVFRGRTHAAKCRFRVAIFISFTYKVTWSFLSWTGFHMDSVSD